MSYDQALEWIKVIGNMLLSWPLVVIALAGLFRKELAALFFHLPEIFSASRIKIGNILEIQKDVKSIGQDVETLKFLIVNLFTKPEVTHLKKIGSGAEFIEELNDEKDRGRFFGTFRDEIARLYNSDFITLHNDSRGVELFDEGGPEKRNVLDHCEITHNGRQFLSLHDQYSAMLQSPEKGNA